MEVNLNISMTRMSCKVATLGLIAFVMFITSCCQDKFITSSPSGNGLYEAKVEESSCGATSPFTSIVSIRSKKPRLGLNWLGNSEKTVYAVDRSASHMTVRWQENNLIITCAKCKSEAVLMRLSHYKDIVIIARETE